MWESTWLYFERNQTAENVGAKRPRENITVRGKSDFGDAPSSSEFQCLGAGEGSAKLALTRVVFAKGLWWWETGKEDGAMCAQSWEWQCLESHLKGWEVTKGCAQGSGVLAGGQDWLTTDTRSGRSDQTIRCLNVSCWRWCSYRSREDPGWGHESRCLHRQVEDITAKYGGPGTLSSWAKLKAPEKADQTQTTAKLGHHHH